MGIDIAPNGYTFVPRSDWGARHSAGRTAMKRPVRKVFIHHTVIPPTSDPCADMRRTEDVLDSRGLAPGYSYCIHPTGVVLEGAGRNKGAHTGGHNSEGFGFSFMGNYDTAQPTLAQIVAASRTINLLRMDGALVSPLDQIAILGHRDTKATACPGNNLYQNLRWIRWFAQTGD